MTRTEPARLFVWVTSVTDRVEHALGADQPLPRIWEDTCQALCGAHFRAAPLIVPARIVCRMCRDILGDHVAQTGRPDGGRPSHRRGRSGVHTRVGGPPQGINR